MILSVPERTAKLKWWFLIFLILTIAFITWMRSFLSPLQSGDIIKFEMAKTTDAAYDIIHQWQRDGKLETAMKSIYCDYGFIILYTVTLALACRYLSAATGND